MPRQYFIGCSGYYYKDWSGKFYPENLPQKEWLAYYAKTFRTVELNNSFYRMPKENAMHGWYNKAPQDFLFTMKGSRYISHMKKLRDTGESVRRLYHMADLLKEKFACTLWQLPKNLHKDAGRLEQFCRQLKPEYQNVIEFRHSSWWEDEEVRHIMKKHNVAFCIISAPGGLPANVVETADFAYMRFHGTRHWYNHHYSMSELKNWAEKIRNLKAGKVYVYFNNDMFANAPKNAQELAALLDV